VKRLYDDTEHQIALEAVLSLRAAETGCPNLSSLNANCIESCRSLLMFAVDRAALPEMPEQRRPRGDDVYTDAERRLLAAAARGLRKVEKLEGVPIRNRDSLADHAELIESRLKSKPRRTDRGHRVAPIAKVRGAALLRRGPIARATR
jgi:hypothetical protein